MQPTPIVRPSWLALHKRTLLGFATVTTIGALGFWYLDHRAPAPAKTIALPSIVTVPAAQVNIPAPIVNVTVEPPPPAEAPIAPPPRALTPFLDAACLSTTSSDITDQNGDLPSPSCEWDDGFPAISGDGKTIALRYSRDDGGRGWLNVAVRFVDVKTSKVLSDHTIVAPEDLDESGESTDKTRAKAARRVAPIQKRLDDGHYRTMKAMDYESPLPGDAPSKNLLLEHESHDPKVRIVDGESNTVLWRGEFNVTKEYPPRKVDPDTDTGCYPSDTNDIYAWFDPTTRAIAFQVSYGSEPCYCNSAIHHYVRRAGTP